MMHFPIADSHFHLLDNRRFTYPWMDSASDLNQPFLLSSMMEATKSLHIESFVFVQAECDVSQTLAEVQWVSELALKDTRLQAIVARAAIERGEGVVAELEALKKYPLVKGVRRILLAESMEFCLQPDFIVGVQALAGFNYRFDLCVKPYHLPFVAQLVEQCPEVHFILEHLGCPDMTEGDLQSWKTNLTRLASLPNVSAKISGLITESLHQGWCSDDLKPIIFHAIDVFSVDRLMFGSDWPVVNLASSYTHWVHTLYDLLSRQLTEKELKKLFYENTRRAYQITRETMAV